MNYPGKYFDLSGDCVGNYVMQNIIFLIIIMVAAIHNHMCQNTNVNHSKQQKRSSPAITDIKNYFIAQYI